MRCEGVGWRVVEGKKQSGYMHYIERCSIKCIHWSGPTVPQEVTIILYYRSIP